MKTLIVALAFCGLSAATQAANPNQSGPAPEYCVGFSPDACARIRAVIEFKVRPVYCVPEYARPDSGLNLTPEQLRICYASEPAPPPNPEMERAWSEIQEKREQQIEDARAMVRESWATYGNVIEAIETGYKCGVVDQLSANAALQNVEVAMRNALIHAGLIDDSTMSIQEFATGSVQAGKSAAEGGACTRMTPASRGRLRSMVSDLTH